MCVFGIYTNEQKDPGFKTTLCVISELKKRGLTYYLDEQIADKTAPELSVKGKKIDYLLVFGGDGTMLSAARKYAVTGAYILGFNMGRLGFLLDTEITEFSGAIDALLAGDFTCEKRLMLNVSVVDSDGCVKSSEYALNEAVISQRHILRLINVDVKVNGELMDSMDCDGIIVATPTGSTGYSLSAGGSIAMPELNIMLITPICYHSLSSGKMIISGDDTVTVETNVNSRFFPGLTLDGQEYFDIDEGDTVVIKKAEFRANFVKYKNKNFFTVMKDKFTEWSRK